MPSSCPRSNGAASIQTDMRRSRYSLGPSRVNGKAILHHIHRLPINMFSRPSSLNSSLMMKKPGLQNSTPSCPDSASRRIEYSSKACSKHMEEPPRPGTGLLASPSQLRSTMGGLQAGIASALPFGTKVVHRPKREAVQSKDNGRPGRWKEALGFMGTRRLFFLVMR